MRKPGSRPRKTAKRGLTPTEQALVARMVADCRKAWAALLAVNKWREIK